MRIIPPITNPQPRVFGTFIKASSILPSVVLTLEDALNTEAPAITNIKPAISRITAPITNPLFIFYHLFYQMVCPSKKPWANLLYSPNVIRNHIWESIYSQCRCEGVSGRVSINLKRSLSTNLLVLQLLCRRLLGLLLQELHLLQYQQTYAGTSFSFFLPQNDEISLNKSHIDSSNNSQNSKGIKPNPKHSVSYAFLLTPRQRQSPLIPIPSPSLGQSRCKPNAFFLGLCPIGISKISFKSFLSYWGKSVSTIVEKMDFVHHFFTDFPLHFSRRPVVC